MIDPKNYEGRTAGGWGVLDMRRAVEVGLASEEVIAITGPVIRRDDGTFDSSVICRIRNEVKGGPLTAEDLANAKLLADAPKMLEHNALMQLALSAAAGAIRDAIYTEDGLDGTDGVAVLNAITAALDGKMPPDRIDPDLDVVARHWEAMDALDAAAHRQRESDAEIARLRGIVPETLEALNDELCEENDRLRENHRAACTAAVLRALRVVGVSEEQRRGNSGAVLAALQVFDDFLAGGK